MRQLFVELHNGNHATTQQNKTMLKHKNDIMQLKQTELRSYIRQLNKASCLAIPSADWRAVFPDWINGQVRGYKLADYRAVAIQRRFPLEGWQLPAVGGAAASADAKPTTAPVVTTTAPVDRKALVESLLNGIDRDECVAICNEIIADRVPDSIPTEKIIVSQAKTKSLGAKATHKAFAEIVQIIGMNLHTDERRFNVAIVGPAGTGKTELAAQVAEALELPFYSTGKIEAEFQLVGFRDAHGNTHRTDFEKAFTEGGLFLFDEFDGSNPRAVTRFNAALSNGWCDFPDGKKTAHKNFRAIAASNTFWGGATREYVGRNQLDAATKDRFSFIDVDYDEQLENALAGRYEGGAAIAERVQKVRKAIAKLKIRHVVSMRATMDVAAFISANMTQARAERIALWKDLSSADILKIEAEIAN